MSPRKKAAESEAKRTSARDEADTAAQGLPQASVFVSFAVAEQHYGLPVENVVHITEMVKITRLPKAPEIVSGVIDFRGKVIPVIDMRRLLDYPAHPYTLRTPIVISHLDGRTAGLAVDTVSGVLDLTPQQIDLPEEIVTEEMLGRIHLLTGVARLPDDLLLLLNPARLLSPEEEKSLSKAMPRPRRRSKKE